MKAIVIDAARDLRIDELDEQKPGPGEVAIKIAIGGICGSDLHYFNHGGIGDTIRLKEPMVLGHEVSGHIVSLGDGVTRLAIGDRVAVSPSRPCHDCGFCTQGQHNHCLNMRFYGSAMPYPHVQGAFREVLVANARQCVVANTLSDGEAAMAEPLAVCLHAVRQAGPLLGKRVLITGSGPIGQLSLLSAKASGAREIVVTDLVDYPLEFARTLGADQAYNVGENNEALSGYQDKKGYFDIVFECSGAAPALRTAVACTRPRGVIVQLGLGGDMQVPVQALTAKELELRGSFRFHEEFALAVELMQKGVIDVRPLVSQTLPIDLAEEAFVLASNRNEAMKTQISF